MEIKEVAQQAHNSTKNPWASVIGGIFIGFGLIGMAEKLWFTLPGPWWVGLLPTGAGVYLIFPERAEKLVKLINKARGKNE